VAKKKPAPHKHIVIPNGPVEEFEEVTEAELDALQEEISDALATQALQLAALQTVCGALIAEVANFSPDPVALLQRVRTSALAAAEQKGFQDEDPQVAQSITQGLRTAIDGILSRVVIVPQA
jgi:hypothetical protein